MAMVAKPRGPLCRCVVRGKDARSALQGYDCEQCRTFYNAAGVGAAAGRRAPKASRHACDKLQRALEAQEEVCGVKVSLFG